MKKYTKEWPENQRLCTAREFQLKFKTIEGEAKLETKLIAIGAKKLGVVSQKDEYYIPKRQFIQETTELLRLREESNEKTLFTFFGSEFDKEIRIKLIFNEVVEAYTAKARLKNFRKINTIIKKRTIYLLDNIQINLDKISQPNLGTFIEFSTRNEDAKDMCQIIKQMGFKSSEAIKSSYYKLALLNMTITQRITQKICSVFGTMAFGISSAGLTVLGLIIGVNAALASRIAIIVSIACIAFADSMADAIGIYTQDRSEGTSSKKAFTGALNNFFGKLFFALSFIIPFFFFSIITAIIIDIIWGFILLVFVNIIIAIIQEESKTKTVLKNLVIATIVLILSYLIGTTLNSLLV